MRLDDAVIDSFQNFASTKFKGGLKLKCERAFRPHSQEGELFCTEMALMEML